MLCELALESANNQIDLGGKSSKTLSVKNESKVIFHDLVADKRGSKEQPLKQPAHTNQVQKEKVFVKEPIQSKTQKSSKELESHTRENETENNSAKLEQAEVEIDHNPLIDPQEVIVPQLVKPEITPVQIESTEPLKAEEVEHFDLNNEEQLENERVIPLSKSEQTFVDFSTESAAESKYLKTIKKALKENENEALSSVNTNLIQNANKDLHFSENSNEESPVADSYVEEFKTGAVNENEFNFTDFEGGDVDAALYARLLNPNLNPKATLQLETNLANLPNDSSIVKISEEEIEMAIKFEGEALNRNLEAPQQDINKSVNHVNLNTLFADTSSTGQEILAAMRSEFKKDVLELTNEELVAEAAEQNLLLNEIEIYAGHGNNNSSNSKFATEIFSYGGTIEINQDDKLVVSFKDNLVVKSNIPHRSEQISLSIKEAISNGKSTVTINMYPKALGAIDIHIEFSTVGGKQIVESIKFAAERRETLDIIHKSEADLRKNLTEVTKSSEEASLEFNLKHNDGNGAKNNYFQNLEEKQNWMNKFQQHLDETVGSNSGTRLDQNSWLTEDSINVIA